MSNKPILVVEDDRQLREALVAAIHSDEQSVVAADNGAAALEVLRTQSVGMVVTDWQMQPIDGLTLLQKIRQNYPIVPTVVMTGHGSIESAVNAMQCGAADYLVKPFEVHELQDVIRKHLKVGQDDDNVIAADPLTIELLSTAARVAATNVTVTISGPSGSGKEVIARYLHQQSKRRNKPFVAVNCAAIPETMLEAMLFGYEKGAFTGAGSAHEGKFEQADGGTLLLDEISEMDLGLQAKLLRVIQEKEVERLGSRKTIALDTRILATTNRDLRQFVEDGKFREDLYYRLNVFPLSIPPLSERRGDILPLTKRIIEQHSSSAVTLSENAAKKLLAHSWPGNVRELENVLQRALILLNSSQIHAADLAIAAPPNAPLESKDLSQGLQHHAYQLIVEAMSEFNGKRADVAAALGISARSLRYKLARMRELGIAIPGEKR